MVAAGIGFVGVAIMGIAAFFAWSQKSQSGSIWYGVIAVFILLQCWRGLTQARLLAKLEEMPRRAGFACPACKQPPVVGRFWTCAKCQAKFDTFETLAVCPGCGTKFGGTACFDCGAVSPVEEWITDPRVIIAAPPIIR